jgi:hypothetical protein
VRERIEIPLQKQGYLADMSRPDDERETHRSIVVSASRAFSYAPETACAKSVETSRSDPCRPTWFPTPSTSGAGRASLPAGRAFRPRNRHRDPPASTHAWRRCN